MIRIERVPGKGRGIIAATDFSAGEFIERAPVIVVPNCEWEIVDETFLFGYIFLWKDEVAVGMGLASFFNHSYSPNAVYHKNFDNLTLDFTALRDIAAGEEILVNYNGEPGDRTPMWFDIRQ